MYKLFVALIVTAGCICCSTREKQLPDAGGIVYSPYKVYLVNKGIHTGLVIPVNFVSEEIITAMEYFREMEFVDFGWGDEAYYQGSDDSFCLGVRAVALPTPSVMRVEGFAGTVESLAQWSDFAVQFNMNRENFQLLCEYIDRSFRRGENNSLILTSKKRKGNVLFFSSVYYYHALNTCNTWAARGLSDAGLDVSPFLVITAEDLFDEVKGRGVVVFSDEL